MTDTTARRFDASDWLSPIIVKELRQGMRGRTFISTFLLLQLALIVVVSGAMAATAITNTDTMQMFSVFFWIIIGAPLIAVIPIMGLGALQNEIKSNSIELVYLTRLSPWRIVAGKWAALSAQSLLFVFSVLPYLVLRYFLGGIDLLGELSTLLVLLGWCLLLTSVTVGLSAFPGWGVRIGFIFFILFGAQMIPALLFSGIFGSMSVTSGPSGIDSNPYIITPIFGALSLLLMLELGTAKISPAAASRSFQIRLIGVAALVFAAALHFLGDRTGVAFSAAMPILLIVCIIALTETPRWIPSIYQPFSSRGTLARFAGRWLFYPGWQTGVVYTTLVWLTGCLLLPDLQTAGDFFPYLGVYVSMMFAVAITRALRPGTDRGWLWFLSVHVAMILLALFYSMLHHMADSSIPAIAAFPPLTLLMSVAFDVVPNQAPELNNIILLVVLGASLLTLGLRVLPLIPLVRNMEFLEPADPAPTA